MAHLTRRSVLRGSAALGATRLLASPHIARGGGDHRDRVVRAGVRPGRGRGAAQGRRRLREGERQQDRAEHHPLRAGTAEDHLGDHQRRRPRYDRFQPGRDPADVRLARPVGRRQRRRGDPAGPVQRDRAARRSGLQQRHQEARHVRRAAQGRGGPLPYLATAGGEGRASRSRTSRRRGTRISTSSRRCRTTCASRASARCMAWASR